MVKFQGTNAIYKNKLSFSRLTTNYQKKNLRKQSPLQNTFDCIRRLKYLGMNLTKEMKDLYTEKYISERNFKRQINGKIFFVHELEELILVKCTNYPKQSTNSIQSPSEVQWHFPQK